MKQFIQSVVFLNLFISISMAQNEFVVVEKIKTDYGFDPLSITKIEIGNSEGVQANTEIITLSKIPFRMSKESIVYENNYFFSLNKKGTLYKNEEKILDISSNSQFSGKFAQFLCKSNNKFVTCLLSEKGSSYSDAIYTISGDTLKVFHFLDGIPSGLFANDKYLWYLFNKNKPGEYGVLRKYNVNDGTIIWTKEIPVRSPSGLFISKNEQTITTYSVETKEIVKLKMKNENEK